MIVIIEPKMGKKNLLQEKSVQFTVKGDIMRMNKECKYERKRKVIDKRKRVKNETNYNQ